LRTVDPLLGAATSVPSFTLLLLLLSPLVVLTVERVRKGSFVLQAPGAGLSGSR
jgi:hypothetical protein